MTYYRYELKLSDNPDFVGFIRGFDFEKAGISKKMSEEMMYPINDALRPPETIEEWGIRSTFWFTEDGFDIMNVIAEEFIDELFAESDDGYLKDARLRIVSMEEDSPYILYRDNTQVCIDESRAAFKDEKIIKF